jgi:hypothetical protein
VRRLAEEVPDFAPDGPEEAAQHEQLQGLREDQGFQGQGAGVVARSE